MEKNEKLNGDRYKPVVENKYMEAIPLRDKYGEKPVILLQNAKALVDPRAQFALLCCEKWGMVAGVPDGEDSAGRMRIRLATPEEIVERAIDVAGKMYDRFEALEWVKFAPSYNDITESMKDKENANG